MEFNNVCSLGTLCHTSYFIKQSNLKTESYPFDWIYSNINVIIDCLEDNFSKFLDKKYYVNVKNSPACSHSLYGNSMFNHYNPLKPEIYDYYSRCVNRFINLLNNSNNKLFIILNVNQNNNKNIDSDIINLYKLNNLLLSKTSNYKILYINHFSNRTPKYQFTQLHNNIDLLDISTKSKSDGVKFIKDSDNIYFNQIITDNYKFNISFIPSTNDFSITL